MLDNSDLIAVIATADLRRARPFYERVLGLPLIDHNEAACTFSAHGTLLRVTVVRQVARTGYTVLGWHVADIAATVSGLAANGVTFRRYEGMDQDRNGIWTTPGGDKVAWFDDPDGNTLSLTEFRTAGRLRDYAADPLARRQHPGRISAKSPRRKVLSTTGLAPRTCGKRGRQPGAGWVTTATSPTRLRPDR